MKKEGTMAKGVLDEILERAMTDSEFLELLLEPETRAQALDQYSNLTEAERAAFLSSSSTHDLADLLNDMREAVMSSILSDR